MIFLLPDPELAEDHPVLFRRSCKPRNAAWEPGGHLVAGLGDPEESAPMEWKPSQQMGSLYGALGRLLKLPPYFPFSSNGLLDKGAQVQNVVTTVSSLGDRLPQ